MTLAQVVILSQETQPEQKQGTVADLMAMARRG